MGRIERSLSDLGRHVAELQDGDNRARFDEGEGRRRFLAVDPPSTTRGKVGRTATARWGWALAAALLAFVVLGVWFLPSAPLAFEVGGSASGTVGDWIAAPPERDLPLHFSDGSSALLTAGGRARVVALYAEGAEVALERGHLDLTVIHRADTRWTVRGGPFQIQVVGTHFETRWDPDAEELELALHEGAIRVSGPVIGEGRVVRTGETLRVSVATNTLIVGQLGGPAEVLVEERAPVEVGKVGAASSALPPSLDAPPRALDVAAQKARASAAEVTLPSEAPPPSAWRALFRDAKYAEALAAAEAEGFDSLCASASAADLSALADVARLGGSATRTGQVLTSLRNRFPGTKEAAAAAFLLGRAAQDRYRDPASAMEWFNRYLAEAPQGELAADARGRLVEVADAMGDQAGAARAAERYLSSYPNGPHAAYARSVLDRAADAGP